MSLRVWLPLTGHLDNQGLSESNVTAINATVATTGKIGSCYSFASNSYLRGTNTFLSNSTQDWSYCCWMKLNATTVGQCLFSCRNSVNTNGIAIFYYGTQWLIDDGSRWTLNRRIPISANIWYHICVVRKMGVGKFLYVNGELDSSTTSTTAATNVCSTYYTIGDSQQNATTAGGNPLNGYLNDVRIYDHALSMKEIKEISKGLVCHYTLAEGNTALYDFESVANKWTPENVTLANYTDTEYGNVLKVTVTNANQRIYRSVSNLWTSGQTYTVSFLAKASATVTCDMSRSLANYSPSFTLDTSWKRYSGQISCTGTVTGGTLSFRITTANVTVYLTQVKLELGTVATPYTPAVGDSHYALMGYNDTTVYDSSGYNYHGTSSGISVSSDTPKYSVSTVFDANTDTIKITPCYSLNQVIDKLSVSIWFKTNTMNSTAPNLWSLGANWFARVRLASTTALWYYLAGTSSTYSTSPTTLTDNVWHHTVFTFNSGVVVMYLDGAQIGTTDHSSTKPTLTVGDIDWYLAGYRANSENFIGGLSDFRIYSTAISADDVKALYQVGASIDKSGNMYAYEFNEV